MKKTKYLLLSLLLLLPLSGCSSKSSLEDTIKSLQENGYLLLTTYDSKNFYDIEGTCYSKEGIKKEESRILSLYEKPYFILVNTKGKDYLTTSWDKEGKELESLGLMDGDKVYTINLKEKQRYVYSLSGHETDEGDCFVYYEGKKEDDTSETCSSSTTKESDKLQKYYEAIFTDADTTEDDYIKAIYWVKDNSAKELEKTLEEKLKNRKKLTNEEIKKSLENNDFLVSKNNDSTITLSKKSDAIYNINITSVLDTSNKPYALMYIYDLYYDSYDSDNNMFYGYYFDTKQEIVLGVDNNYAYSLTDEESVGTVTCSKEFKDTADTVQSTFERELSDSNITLDELVSFLKTY